jgi:hypothetical protein
MAAVRVGQAAFSNISRGAGSHRRIRTRLEQSFLKISRAATFSTAGEGAESLTAKIEANHEQ